MDCLCFSRNLIMLLRPTGNRGEGRNPLPPSQNQRPPPETPRPPKPGEKRFLNELLHAIIWCDNIIKLDLAGDVLTRIILNFMINEIHQTPTTIAVITVISGLTTYKRGEKRVNLTN